VKRSRLTLVDRQPICAWSTYYPLHLVEDVIDDMKQGMGYIVEHIKQKHGMVIGRAKDKYTARITTFEEQALFQLLNSEPVLVLQRVSYTRDRKVLILYSDMVLMGSWFAPEHEYDVDIW
jgi:DNA-binding GntR family transcriptional regulator